MINYTYSFSRDEKDTTVSLSPSYRSPFFNVSNLKGSSSTGKSTLMNLIALAFWGYDDPKIQQSLRNRVKYIHDSEKIQLDFNIEMTSIDGSGLKAHVVKKNGNGTSNVDIKVRICDGCGNERPIFKEEFRQKYSLIYDIPDNPTKRIDKSLEDICSAQKKYLEKVRDLKKNVADVLEDIRNSRDPEKIAEYEHKLSENEKQKENDVLLLSETRDLINMLEKYYWASILNNAYQELIDLDENIEKLKKKVRTVKRANKKQSTQYELAVSDYDNNVVKFCELYNISTQLLDKLKQYGEIDTILIDSWSKYNFNHSNLNINLDVPKDFTSAANNLANILKELCKKYDSQQDIQKYTLLKSIMDVLKNYSDSNNNEITILDKTTDDIYCELEHELKGIEDKVSLFKAYDNALSQIIATSKQADAVHQFFISIPEKPMGEETPEMSDSLLGRKSDLEGRIKELLERASGCGVNSDNVANIIEDSFDNSQLLPYVNMSIEKLSEELQLFRNKAEELNDNIFGYNGYNAKIGYLQRMLSDLQKSKDHPLSHHIKRVEKLVKKLDEIQSDLGKKNDILEKVIGRNNNLVNIKQGTEQDIYLKKVWNNLGKRFGHIRHMNQEYEIVEVNIIDSRMVTTTGKEFSINDMGTGESQCAYLMNVLRSNQKTCIIAMFDESENMDYNLRQGILKKFKELYDEGHLLLGLTASHHNGFDTESIVEEYDGNQ